jgi:hypothetical protein
MTNTFTQSVSCLFTFLMLLFFFWAQSLNYNEVSLINSFFFWGGRTGVWTQSLMLALYHAPSQFFLLRLLPFVPIIGNILFSDNTFFYIIFWKLYPFLFWWCWVWIQGLPFEPLLQALFALVIFQIRSFAFAFSPWTGLELCVILLLCLLHSWHCRHAHL